MAVRTWISGTVGRWFDTANWTTEPPDANHYPQAGDTVTISSGRVRIPAADQPLGPIEHETITIGGLNGTASVTLWLGSVTFGPDVEMTVTDPDPSEPLSAFFRSHGTSSFEGQLFVEALGGKLTIDARTDGTSANFILDDAGGRTLVLVAQESALVFKGERITNAAVVQVEGAVTIAAGTEFFGDGSIRLEAGGRLVVRGTVGEEQKVDFADGTNLLKIADASLFHGEIGFTEYGGDVIDLKGVKARSAGYEEGVLTLYSGKDQSGSEVASLRIRLLDAESLDPLPPDEQTLEAGDFTLSRGGGGTRITYTPEGPTYLEAALAVPVVAQTGSLVSLQDMFLQSFGTATPDFHGVTLMPAPRVIDSFTGYWGQPPEGEAVEAGWIVNGTPISEPKTVTAADDVRFLVGNNIGFPPAIQVQVTPDSTGDNAGFVTYSVWSVDPRVAKLAQAFGVEPGRPVPADIVAAAMSWAGVFPGVQNDNLCNWIGDDVAAAAGATMPNPDALLDPELNVEGGFWRIAYRASDSIPPVEDWSSLVRPGDIVRLQWVNGGGHTTTVLSVNDDGTITVYDNIDIVNGVSTIGIHDASYWDNTDPAGITIYRLDPDQQYLIEASALGERVQGTVFDDVVRAGAGADNAAGSIGDDSILGQAGDDTLTGEAGADTLAGGLGADVLEGLGGNDVIRGGVGGDILEGGRGRDLLAGGVGNDSLAGGVSDDTLAGGPGRDTLLGGEGADNFQFDAPLDTAANFDSVGDFRVADDTFVLDGAIFAGLSPGVLAASQFVIGPAAEDEGGRILYDEATGVLLYDPDGEGSEEAVAFARAAPGLTLTNLDFIVV